MEEIINYGAGWYERDVLGEDVEYVSEAPASSFISYYTVVNTITGIPVVTKEESVNTVSNQLGNLRFTFPTRDAGGSHKPGDAGRRLMRAKFVRASRNY